MRGRRIDPDADEAVLRLGRLPFVGGRLLGQLRAEAREASDGEPGDVLRRLAVSRQLREAVSAAAGKPVVPTYQAVYQHHRPDTSVRPHKDKAGYDLVLHMTLDCDAVLEVYRDGADAEPQRIPLAPGEALVLRGRQVLHGWSPTGPDEHRTLIAIGFHDKEHHMPDDDEPQREQDDAAEAERLPDLDVTDESGEAVKGGIPKIPN